MQFFEVSVPIRGLFNLTMCVIAVYNKELELNKFPSPSGDYLI